jgi:hypothetical protein
MFGARALRRSRDAQAAATGSRAQDGCAPLARSGYGDAADKRAGLKSLRDNWADRRSSRPAMPTFWGHFRIERN